MDTKKQFARIAKLKDGWDGDNAPAPSIVALYNANQIVNLAIENGLTIRDADADVIGGIGIWIKSHSSKQKEVWVSCLNGGQRSAVLIQDEHMVHSFKYDDETSMSQILRFLTNQ